MFERKLSLILFNKSILFKGICWTTLMKYKWLIWSCWQVILIFRGNPASQFHCCYESSSHNIIMSLCDGGLEELLKSLLPTWAFPPQGPYENGLGLASFTGCGPCRGRGGRHEWLETSTGLHEETALGEDWGFQGFSPELEDEGQGKFTAHAVIWLRMLCTCAELWFDIEEVLSPLSLSS